MRYLDNAATSFPKAPGVAQAMANFLNEDAANPGRAGHRMAIRAEQMLDALRLRLARLINSHEPQRIVLTLNATDALNIAINGVLSSNQARAGSVHDRAHVVTTVLEHNSVSRPLQRLAEMGLVDVSRVDCDALGYIDPADIDQAITPATRLVVMTHASNVLGTIQPAAAVGAICRQRDVLFCLDAAQTVGHLPLDVGSLQADLIAFPGHKGLLGPTGIGALYVGERCGLPSDAQSHVASTARASTLRAFATFREGGSGGDSASPTQPTLMPYYLEAGTPNTVGAAGLIAALDYHQQARETATESVPVAANLGHEQQLIRQLREQIGHLRGVTLLGGPDVARSVGVVSFTIEGYEAGEVAAILDSSFDIAVRAGLHCAPYAHRAVGTYPAGAVRVSPGPFNSEADMAAVIDALRQITD